MSSLAEICGRVASKEELVSLLDAMNSQCNSLLADNDRLREALILADLALKGANMNMNVVFRKVQEALKNVNG